MDVLVELAKAFLQIGLFSYGGGYAIVALIRHVVVQQQLWLSDPQFLDVLAISQITPGPLAINTATFVGYIKGGILGSITATTASIVAPFLLVYGASHLITKTNPIYLDLFFERIVPLSFGLVIAATLSIGRASLGTGLSVVIFLFALLLTSRTKLNSATVLLLSAILGEVIYVFFVL